MHRALLPLILASPAALASYGDCACTCCAIDHPGGVCNPMYQGYNTLSSCNSCSAALCASRYHSACPRSPTSGGQFGFGGHTSYACNGWDSDTIAHDAEAAVLASSS